MGAGGETSDHREEAELSEMPAWNSNSGWSEVTLEDKYQQEPHQVHILLKTCCCHDAAEIKAADEQCPALILLI